MLAKIVVSHFGWLLAAAPLVFGYWFWWFKGIATADSNRRKMIGRLLQDTYANRYRRMINGALDWLDRRLSKTEISEDIPNDHRAMAWSFGLLNFNLTIAIVYPVLMLMLHWVISGIGEVTDFVVIPKQSFLLIRYAPLIAAVVAIILLVHLNPTDNNKKNHFAKLVIFGLALFFLIEITKATSLIFAVIFVFCLAFFRNFAGFGTVAVFYALTIVSARTTPQPLFIANMSSTLIAAVFAVLATGLLAVIFTWVPKLRSKYRGIKFNNPTKLLATWVLIGFFGICAIVILTQKLPNSGSSSTAGVILFMGILPLFNGLADFASIGSTRYFLRRGAKESFWKYAFFDIAVAILIFLMLGGFIILTIHYLRPQDGIAMLDLSLLFKGLRDNPTEYWWLFFMLFSTILPTIAHLAIALMAAFTMIPKRLRHWIANDLILVGTGKGKDFLQEAKRARIALSLAFTAAMVLPAFLIIEALRLSPWLVHGIIGIFEGFARLIGAI